MNEKLKEITEHLKEWIECDPGDGCGKCDEMRNIIKELTDIAEAMQPETTVCSNCGEHVKKIIIDDMCPKCYC